MKKFSFLIIIFIFIFFVYSAFSNNYDKIYEISDLSFDNTINDIDYNPVDSVNFIIKLGKYEQDNNIENGKEDIEWIVLKKTNKEIILLSRYILDTIKINSVNPNEEKIFWKNSNIRKWLNEDFFNSSFTNIEKNSIIPQKNITNTRNIYEDNSNITINTDDISIDKVSLLSIDEYYEFFGKYNKYPSVYGISNEDIKNDYVYNELQKRIIENKKAGTKKTNFVFNKNQTQYVNNEKLWNYQFAPYILRNFILDSKKINTNNEIVAVSFNGIIDKTNINEIYIRPMIYIKNS